MLKNTPAIMLIVSLLANTVHSSDIIYMPANIAKDIAAPFNNPHIFVRDFETYKGSLTQIEESNEEVNNPYDLDIYSDSVFSYYKFSNYLIRRATFPVSTYFCANYSSWFAKHNSNNDVVAFANIHYYQNIEYFETKCKNKISIIQYTLSTPQNYKNAKQELVLIDTDRFMEHSNHGHVYLIPEAYPLTKEISDSILSNDGVWMKLKERPYKFAN